MSRRSYPPLTPQAALRWSIVCPIVARLDPSTVLEFGCGLGAVGVRLARLATYTAAEPDDRSFEVASQRLAAFGGTVIHGDHTKVPRDTRYDLVCAFEVLEHIADDGQALADWLTLVRPGGHILLSVPADPERFGPSDVLVGHYRRYTADQLRTRLTEAGATGVSVWHYGWPLGYLLDSARDRLARRRGGTPLPAIQTSDEETARQRTHASGRFFQPRGPVVGGLIRAAVAPFAAVQRLRPGRGPGLIALATRPAG